MATDGDGQLSWANARNSGGSVFTRWGNTAAPAGTTLLYAGCGYAGHYTHAGCIGPIVVQNSDPGPNAAVDAGLLYLLATDAPEYMPPGIAGSRLYFEWKPRERPSEHVACLPYAEPPYAWWQRLKTKQRDTLF